MPFLDKLNTLASTASEKANSALENGKLAIKINSEEKKITENTAKIGEIVVKQLDAGTSMEPEIMELYDEIGTFRDEIEKLKRQQDEVKIGD